MISDLKEQQLQYMNFTAYNKLLMVGAAAICIGLATKEAISNLMNEVLLPFITFISNKSLTHIFYIFLLQKSAHYKWINGLIWGLGRTIWIFLVWVLILYSTYLIFQYVIKFDLVTDKLDFVSYLNNKIRS
jgi:hypothetical protein